MRWMLGLAAAGLLATAAHAEETPEAATRSDLKCVLAMTAMLQMPQYKDAAGAGLFYFVGRLEGRDPSIDLAAALRRAAGNLQSSDYLTEGQRCGALLREKNNALKSVGEAMKAR